ncbi:MAG: hypothetical protein NC548_14770 [Lachnospiraceae bacterium]|nr:hypothetical protein [Lachnospiraceae bacterium]
MRISDVPDVRGRLTPAGSWPGVMHAQGFSECRRNVGGRKLRVGIYAADGI